MSRRWIIWGTIATLPPLANLYFTGREDAPSDCG